MSNVIVVGGGWSGCAAAISAKKAGAEVTVLERTDMLLGTELVGGIMRNSRYRRLPVASCVNPCTSVQGS